VLLPEDFPVGRDELLQTLLDQGSRLAGGSWRRTAIPAYADHPHAPLPVTERLTHGSVILPCTTT